MTAADIEAPFPANELETAVQRARAVEDRPYLLRALARSVVCLAREPEPGPGADPPPGLPRFADLDLTRRPLPLVTGEDGRSYLLVFTSSFRLFGYYADESQTWMQTRAGSLAAITRQVPWIVNLAHPQSVVLQPADVAVIADLAEGRTVAEAITGGEASSFSLERPGARADDLGDVLAPALRGSPVQRAAAALVRWDPPDVGAWLRIGLVCAEPAGGEAAEARRATVAALEAATTEPIEVRVLAAEPTSPSDRWLVERGSVLWEPSV